MIDYLLILILIIFVYVFVKNVFLSVAPWLPSKKREVNRMVGLIDLKPGMKVYDLGCGDGRLLISAYKKEPKIKIVGVEMNYLMCLITKINFWLHNIKAKILVRDLFKVNLSDADVIFIYLLPKSYERLKEKFAKELKQGTKIIVGIWPIDNWKEILCDKPTKNHLSIYVYEIGRSEK